MFIDATFISTAKDTYLLQDWIYLWKLLHFRKDLDIIEIAFTKDNKSYDT